MSEIDPKSYSSIPHLMEGAFGSYGDRLAFSNMGRSLTYKELHTLSVRLASYLQNQWGLQKGDRLAIMMPNVLQYPVALFGALRAGLTVVNVNPLYSPRELKHQLADSGATGIIIFENAANTLQQVLPETPIKNVIVTGIGDLLGPLKGPLVNFVIKRVKKMVPPYQLPMARTFGQALSWGDSELFREVSLRPEDMAFLQYTGGTTGVSKGAVLSHGNIVANILQIKSWIAPTIGPSPQEVIATALPLYHIFSLTANALTISCLGGHNLLITNPRDFKSLVSELKGQGVTIITGVNTLFNGLAHDPGFCALDFSTLKLSLGGGMAVQKSVSEAWEKVTGTPIVQAYGLTEASPAICVNPLGLKEFRGSVGLPLPSTEVVVKDAEENNLPQGEVGEICAKGPQVMQGYWNRPDETAQVFSQDQFLKTGDLGTIDKEGFVTIVDRKKDMILVSGFNVYPGEIEEVAASHPEVLECAAVGVPSAKSGEVVKLFAVRKSDSLKEEDLRSFCRQHLANYKVPAEVEFRPDLPKSHVGKILRKDLRPS